PASRRRDVSPPRPDGPRLAGEPVGRPARGLRDPLRSDLREADRGRRRQRDARAWGRRAPSLRARVPARVRPGAGGAGPPRRGGGAVREDPLPRHRGRALQIAKRPPRPPRRHFALSFTSSYGAEYAWPGISPRPDSCTRGPWPLMNASSQIG